MEDKGNGEHLNQTLVPRIHLAGLFRKKIGVVLAEVEQLDGEDVTPLTQAAPASVALKVAGVRAEPERLFVAELFQSALGGRCSRRSLVR